MQKPEVSIVIPNYKTPELTRLCLRSLRRHTDLERVRVIVVDNDSHDASLDYLRKVEWIELLERTTDGESGPEMHARALDLALEKVDTPFLLVIHTDTIVVNDLWLDFLLNRINSDPNIAGVGSWKLEIVPFWKRIGKFFEEGIRRLAGRHRVVEERYLRSHCALYRTELVRSRTSGFFDGDTAGHSLHRSLVEAGYRMVFIESPELMRFIRHLNHATMILNPETGGRKTTRPAARRRLEKELKSLHYDELMEDDSLDRCGR